jgi:DNA-binding SARP family transcriptional activator
MTLRLRTFGSVYVERDGAPLGGAHSQRRRLALLAYLAAADGGTVGREKLIGLLWPESDESSARHSLSQLLYAVRQGLGEGVLLVDSQTIRLDAGILPSDVQAFDAALRAGRLEEAVAEYRGAFLDGFHVDDAPDLNRWIDAESAARTHACARALDRLADASEKSGNAHRAAEWLRRRIALDPADSRVTLRLMNALSAVGDCEGAVRAARVYEGIVREHLELEPDAAVMQLAGKLHRGVTPRPIASVEVEAPVQVRPASLRLSKRVWIGVAAVTVIAFIGVSAALRGDASGRDATSGAGARVVIGELEGPDSVLALAVREALRAELANKPGVLLISDAGIRELKGLMRMHRDSALRRPQLIALAWRSGSNVAVAGSVVPVGTGAQIVLDLIDPASGRTLRSFAERPVDGRATLQAVERIARAIGTAVSVTPLDTTVASLPAVTTASLSALKSYALARQTAAAGFRKEAVAPAERAVSHDSTFVLAHYFLGDLLWFIDEQTHSEAHLEKAYALRGTVPPREQLVIRARYEQLARDRPDSALVYWQLLADASPGDGLAYEGRSWALRALGRHEEAAATADSAMRLDPGALLPHLTNAMYSWLAVGDTASAIEIATRVAPRFPHALVEARFYTALFRDPRDALRWADSTVSVESRHSRRHQAQVAAGDLVGARATLDSVLKDDAAQVPPNSMINQGWLELVAGGGAATAAALARDALDWTRRRDISPPAVGRLAERIGDLAARSGDVATVRAAIVLVQERDRGRSLPSYALALRTLYAALSYARGDYLEAATRAEAARHGVYFSRSLATIALLEADARRAAGQRAHGDSLARLVSTHQIVDGHFEAWAAIRAVSAIRDSARRPAAVLRVSRSLGPGSGRGQHARKLHAEHGSVLPGFDMDRSAVRPDDLVDDVQAEAQVPSVLP